MIKLYSFKNSKGLIYAPTDFEGSFDIGDLTGHGYFLSEAELQALKREYFEAARESNWIIGDYVNKYKDFDDYEAQSDKGGNGA